MPTVSTVTPGSSTTFLISARKAAGSCPGSSRMSTRASAAVGMMFVCGAPCSMVIAMVLRRMALSSGSASRLLRNSGSLRASRTLRYFSARPAGCDAARALK